MKLEHLLPKLVRRSLPLLGATEHEENPLARVKFFYPDFSWTWYGIEFDGDDLFFGLVDGFEKELGYFHLSELMTARGRFGMEIERDRFFTPKPMKELLYGPPCEDCGIYFDYKPLTPHSRRCHACETARLTA